MHETRKPESPREKPLSIYSERQFLIYTTVDFPKNRFLVIYSSQRVLSERKFAILNRARWVLSRKFKLTNDH